MTKLVNKVETEDLLNSITPDKWFRVKDLDVEALTRSTSARLKNVKEFKQRQRPDRKKKAIEFFISKNDLIVVKRRLRCSGQISVAEKITQVITPNKLSVTDKMYNQFLGVGVGV